MNNKSHLQEYKLCVQIPIWELIAGETNIRLVVHTLPEMLKISDDDG